MRIESGEQDCSGVASRPAARVSDFCRGKKNHSIMFIRNYFLSITSHFLLKVDVKGFRWPAALDILPSDPGVIAPGREQLAFHNEE